MASDPSEWPAPVRALLWWPLIAFVLVMLDTERAPAAIAIAGAVLAGVGALVAVVRARRAGGSEAAAVGPAVGASGERRVA